MTLYDLRTKLRSKTVSKASRGLVKVASAVARKKGILKDRIVLIGHIDFGGNAGAFYDWLLANGYNDTYEIAWLLRDTKRRTAPRNVSFHHIVRPSIKKAWDIATARFILCEAAPPRVCQPGQVVLYMTHGGLPIKNTHGIINLGSKVTHALCTTPQTKDLFIYSYGLEVPPVELLHIGYPSHDTIATAGDVERVKVLPAGALDKKLVVWMPTFRKGGGAGRNDSSIEDPLGVPLLRSQEDYQRLDEYLAAKGVHLVIKIHPGQDLATLHIGDTDNISVIDIKRQYEDDIENYRLMACADALVSDYSSAALNYLQADRPVAFMVGDVDAYKPGFLMSDPENYIAGPTITTFDEFISFIDDVAQGRDGYAEKRREVCERLYGFHDDRNCERLMEFLEEYRRTTVGDASES